jgi:hypothetical protein
MSATAIITDIDRDWAMAQMPYWCQRGDLSECDCEIVDDGTWPEVSAESTLDTRPNWSHFVADEIERFERHYAGQQKPAQEWSSIWRKGWWPKVSARKRFPKSAPREFHPFFRQGSPEFSRAMAVATVDERRLWLRFGVAQLRPDDPRLRYVREGEPR